jgi:hypothetical protein
MKRALETAVIVSGGKKIVLVPELRERMSFKNTVASSVAELKEFVAVLKNEYGQVPEIDYSRLTHPFWYLEVLKKVETRTTRAEELIKVA